MITSDSTIDDLGGTGAVAEALALADSTVSKWRIRGIPPRQWVGIARLAKSKGCRHITLEALASAGVEGASR